MNTIDAGTPTSSVTPLPTTNFASFAVSWSGTDDAGGSGIGLFDIFVSVDGGAFTLWLDDTADLSALYQGTVGHTYSFYSRATDNVGHTEAAPTMADASTLTVLEPGDYDRDGIVEVDDYLVWRSSFGLTGLGLAADGNQNGVVDAADYVVWRKNTWRIVHDASGDYNNDNIINKADYDAWRASFGQVGPNLAADGNHNGIVDAADYVLWRSRDRSIVVPLPGDGSDADLALDSALGITSSAIDSTEVAPQHPTAAKVTITPDSQRDSSEVTVEQSPLARDDALAAFISSVSSTSERRTDNGRSRNRTAPAPRRVVWTDFDFDRLLLLPKTSSIGDEDDFELTSADVGRSREHSTHAVALDNVYSELELNGWRRHTAKIIVKVP